MRERVSEAMANITPQIMKNSQTEATKAENGSRSMTVTAKEINLANLLPVYCLLSGMTARGENTFSFAEFPQVPIREKNKQIAIILNECLDSTAGLWLKQSCDRHPAAMSYNCNGDILKSSPVCPDY